jgi:hypothetical protein
MGLQRYDNSFSSENWPARAEPAFVLEPTSLRLKVLGQVIELSGSTIPQSPKSLAACLLFNIIAMLGLTCGLGGLCHWLGSPLWLCLVAAGIGLAISASFALACLVLAFLVQREARSVLK